MDVLFFRALCDMMAKMTVFRRIPMLPQAFLSRMQTLLGEEYAAFLTSYEQPRNKGLRFHPLKTGVFPPLPFLREPVPWEPCGFYLDPQARPGLHPYHDAGVYYLQEPSAMAPARLLDPQPGERVLDLCAAPGGKSTQLAAMMQGKGLLVCNEIHPKRAHILSSNVERLGIANALVLNEHPARLAERFPRFFDRILVDAPCSGEGMFRKETAAVEDWSREIVQMCAARQYEILCSAAQMLSPGGRLVYSTCTFSPEENEGVISRFLRTHPGFSVENVDAPWFSPGRPDCVEDAAPGLEHTFRLFPHKLRGEGHFAAVLCSTDDGKKEPAPLQKGIPAPRALTDFCMEYDLCLPEGDLISFGQCCYLGAMPELHSLRVLRAGLELGEIRKDRFLPAHALALWLKSFPVCADFPADSAEIDAYLRGEVLSGSQIGWTLITVDGYSLGWAKGATGTLKNHYPKGLRHLR